MDPRIRYSNAPCTHMNLTWLMTDFDFNMFYISFDGGKNKNFTLEGHLCSNHGAILC